MTTSDKEAMSKEPGFNFHEVITHRERDYADAEIAEMVIWDLESFINIL